MFKILLFNSVFIITILMSSESDPPMGSLGSTLPNHAEQLNVLSFTEKNSIPTFTGERESDLLFDYWCLKLQDLISITKSESDEEKIGALRFKLGGPARRFFEALPSNTKINFEKTIEAFRAKYQKLLVRRRRQGKTRVLLSTSLRGSRHVR